MKTLINSINGGMFWATMVFVTLTGLIAIGAVVDLRDHMYNGTTKWLMISVMILFISTSLLFIVRTFTDARRHYLWTMRSRHLKKLANETKAINELVNLMYTIGMNLMVTQKRYGDEKYYDQGIIKSVSGEVFIHDMSKEMIQDYNTAAKFTILSALTKAAES